MASKRKGGESKKGAKGGKKHKGESKAEAEQVPMEDSKVTPFAHAVEMWDEDGADFMWSVHVTCNVCGWADNWARQSMIFGAVEHGENRPFTWWWLRDQCDYKYESVMWYTVESMEPGVPIQHHCSVRLESMLPEWLWKLIAELCVDYTHIPVPLTFAEVPGVSVDWSDGEL